MCARRALLDPTDMQCGRAKLDLIPAKVAAPHVAGLLAAFVSLRREFVGYPVRVENVSQKRKRPGSGRS